MVLRLESDVHGTGGLSSAVVGPAWGHQPGLVGAHHRLHPVAHLASPAVSRRPPGWPRRGTAPARSRRSTCPWAPASSFEHLGLALAQRRQGRIGPRPPPARELRDQPPGDRPARAAASPRATVRTAATRSSGGASLSRKPQAPACSARESVLVGRGGRRISTAGCQPGPTIAAGRRRSRRPGIRMSIRTTSGAPGEPPCPGFDPVAGLADHLDVGLGLQQRSGSRRGPGAGRRR